MQFDVFSLLTAAILISALSTIARALLVKLHPHFLGLGAWAWASATGTLALLVMATRPHFPGQTGATLAQILVAIGLVLSWQGFRLFTGFRGLSRQVFLVLMIGLAIPVGLSFIEGGLPLRSATNAMMLCMISALIAQHLLASAEPGWLAMRVTGYLYAVNSVFFLIRMVAVFASGEIIGTTQSSGFTALTALWWLGMTLASTLGMTLMASEKLQFELNQQANHDPLTGALNRRAFIIAAEKTFAWASRQGTPIALLMMDLDYFKQVNDRLGHQAGDDLLRLFAAVCEREIRSEDSLCRFGGEEFVVLLPGSSATLAWAAAERLRAAFAEAAAQSDVTRTLSFAVTVSIGVSELEIGEDLHSALRRADAALYWAKQTGRNRTEMATPRASVMGAH